ncbi:lytic transglycosylase domain-containing protein [Sphingomonas sp.]|uniref:lytic transglycosylase domain-containing protein n=1 Tax=Sphingomonas sp. TaxID=28214 RepID=UPI0025DD46A5|nr:lytic transglycosylase domain-containing protein [Sphingomonas sp.]MBV9526999.1 lytic transglycosylase domain-containing protein [Sphingomonas sp.]MBV9842258.1 lytic transglycosylase domain-containing protein [Sphingomonadaceae bacterium]
MDALRSLAAFALLVAPAATGAQPAADHVARWRPYIAEASSRFAVPAEWIEHVMRAESFGLTTLHGRPIRSKAGAMGLMQLMPATWTAMRNTYHLGTNPDDPHDNIIAGAAFLAMMRDRFGYPGMFAAYNAGAARYAAYLAGQSRLPRETVAYLGAITGEPGAAAVIPTTSPRQLLFVLRHDLAKQDQPPIARPASDGMFAILRGQR